MKHRIAILAGGTGGHISPGIALAEILTDRSDFFSVEFVCLHSLKRNSNNPDLESSPCLVLWHNSPLWKWTRFLTFPILFFFDFIRTFFQFKKHKINAVIGMGGYSTIPGLVYALIFRKSIYLCEQNCMPGKITRIFARFSKKLAYSFPSQIDLGKDSKILGNPIRKRVLPEKINLRLNENLTDNRKTQINVLVLGGSQGARQLNNMILNALENSEIASKFQFRLLTGTALYEETKEKASENTELISYTNDMKPNYEWANLVIARSGAGVVAECLIFGLPMILVPYPFAADNHQKANADFLEKEGAASVIHSTSEDPRELISILLKWKTNTEALKEMGHNSLRLSNINSAFQTIQYFLKQES